MFLFAQDTLGIPKGSIRATVLIETLPAAFEMDDILWEMRDDVMGMNAGRWDYIFSFIKTFAKNSNYVLPDRSQVVMGEGFLGGYASLLVRTCHRRGAFAMGGMAAQIPIKNDSQANAAAFAKVRADKEREVRDGYDGTWVAHPDLVPVAKEVFDRLMPRPNQTDRVRLHVRVLRNFPPKKKKKIRPKRACALISGSAYNISMLGCAGAERCRSTISWKTRRPPRSPARRFGNGSNTAPCSRAA